MKFIQVLLTGIVERLLRDAKILDSIVEPFLAQLLTPGNEEVIVKALDFLDEQGLDRLEELAPNTHKRLQESLIRILDQVKERIVD